MKYKEDTQSIKSVIEALYAVVSGEHGEHRNWERERNLFLEGGMMYVVGEDGETNVFSPQEYARDFSVHLGNPAVYEIEEEREEYIHGNLATVISHYATYKQKGDDSPYKRGVNMLQLLNDGSRWWILTITWDRRYNKLT